MLFSSSDHIVVPCNTDALSWLGLDLLSKLIQDFGRRNRRRVPGKRPGTPVPLVSTVIINDFHTTRTAVNAYSKERFEKRISNLKKGGHVQ